MGISKQTVNINKLVLGDLAKDKLIKYVPHGINSDLFFPIQEGHKDFNNLLEFKNILLLNLTSSFFRPFTAEA